MGNSLGTYSITNNTFFNLSGNIFIYHFAIDLIVDTGTYVTQSDAIFFMNL